MSKNNNNNHYAVGGIVAAVFALTICSAVVYNYYFAIEFEKKIDPNTTLGEYERNPTISPGNFDTSEISNLEAIKPALKKYIADTVMPRKVYTFTLEDIQPFYTKDGAKIEVAKLVTKYGNGVYYMPPQVVYLINNKLYIAAWGGETYEYKSMDSVNKLVYKHFQNLTYSVKGLIPLDQMGLNYLYEDPQGLRDTAVTSAQAETGIYGIQVGYDAEENVDYVNVMRKGDWEASTPGATIVPRVLVMEFPENRSTIDPATESARQRPRPGFVTGKTGVHSRFGFKLWYPATLNGVVVEYQGSEYGSDEHHYLIAGGDPSQAYIQADSAKMYCSGNSSGYIAGDQKGIPYVIATSSRSKLQDWSFQSYGASDEFTFVTQSAVCTMSVSGAMRLSMFSVEL